MKGALLVLLVVTLGLVATVGIAGRHWPPVEHPPRQGEGLDPAAFARGTAVHSSQALSRMIREPQNTWSNLAFVFAGALLISRRESRKVRMVALALIGVGIGSFLYHASASRTLRHGDVAAMYGLFFTTSLLAVGSWSHRLSEKFESHAGALSIAAVLFALWITLNRNFVVLGMKPFSLSLVTAVAATILILAIGTAVFRRRCVRTTLLGSAALALFTLAVACQVGDRPGGWLCAPDSRVQAHALWHVFSAMAIYAAVRALEEERYQTTPVTRGGTGRPIVARDPRAGFRGSNDVRVRDQGPPGGATGGR